MFPRWPQQAHNHEVSRADTVSVPRAPTQAEVAAVLRIMTPLRKVIKPKVYGIENVPTERALLVGNHNTLGLVDAPLLAAELWERGRIVRSLGDHAHFKIPGWRDALTRTGVVEGTREITSELMRRGELVMVFPGGAREVNKRKNERYKLVWKNRLGFARLAIQHGYPIVPFASVGAEHGIDIVLDNESPLAGTGPVPRREAARHQRRSGAGPWCRTDTGTAPRTAVLLVRRANRHHRVYGAASRR